MPKKSKKVKKLLNNKITTENPSKPIINSTGWLYKLKSNVYSKKSCKRYFFFEKVIRSNDEKDNAKPEQISAISLIESDFDLGVTNRIVKPSMKVKKRNNISIIFYFIYLLLQTLYLVFQ